MPQIAFSTLAPQHIQTMTRGQEAGHADRRSCLLPGGSKPCVLRARKPYFDKRLTATALLSPHRRFPK